MPRSLRLPPLVLASAVSFGVLVALWLVAADDHQTRALIADASRTWSAAFAAACCGYAWRRIDAPHLREAWRWIGFGALSYLVGQLYWNYHDLFLGTDPGYPSFADVGYLGTYPCFAVAIRHLLRGEQRRPLTTDLLIDGALITFTAGALAYEFLLDPIFETRHSGSALAASILWSIGGVIVLWLLAVQSLRRTTFPLATAGLVGCGLVVFCVTNVRYAMVALDGTYTTGGYLDLGGDAALLLIAAAAGLAPTATARRADTQPDTSQGTRLVALLLGLAGVAALAVYAALSPPEIDTAVLLVTGLAIIGVRFTHALLTDRRYTDLLEREVAHQTRSLMDSLSVAAAAERHLRTLMEAVPDAIVVLERDGRFVETNAAARLLAPPQGELANRSIYDLLDPIAHQVVRDNLTAAFEGATRQFEIPFQRDDRLRGIGSVTYAPIRESGRITRVLALVRDISEQRRTENQLQQAEKLAALGQLVSGVAHEINNPAAIISGFAQTLMLDDLDPEQHEMVKMVYDEATRIGRITANLLAFARAGGRERTLVDLNEMVRRTFALRSYHLSTLNITLNLVLDPTGPHAWANGSELQQLILNLLINAEQALTTIDGTRTIVFRTAATDHDVTIECRDTGPGIPAEIREKIFDPFFTTKPEGIGTGLGLSICYGIAHDHGGRITVDSTPGHGATFTVVLPRDPRGETRPTAPLAPRAVAGRSTGPVTVLLVDDEAGLRKAVARYLSRRGFLVRAVGDGAEALRVLETEEFQVILSDVRMPGINGREFLARLRREHPELVARLVFTTGDTFAPDTATLLEESRVPAVVKPFDFPKLEQLIRDVAAGVTTSA